MDAEQALFLKSSEISLPCILPVAVCFEVSTDSQPLTVSGSGSRRAAARAASREVFAARQLRQRLAK